MGLKKGENRSQFRMLCSEELVEADDMVRVIDAFVEALDMDSFGFESKGESDVGRPAFSNEVMLKIFLFCYMINVRNSRGIAKACRYDVRIWWLAEGLKPKYRVVADFRKNNKTCFKKVFRSFTLLLQRNKLITGKIIAVDGTKIKASNSRKNNYSEKKFEKVLKHADEQIEQYIADLDAADKRYDEEEASKINGRLAQVQERKQDRLKLLEKMENEGLNQISKVDEDAKLMHLKLSHTEMAYNVQAATCAENNLIVDFEVTNETDTYALHNVCTSTQDLLGIKRIKVLADTGYYTGLELRKCKESKIETYVSPKASGPKKESDYGIKKFKYNKKKDCYVCPAGKALKTDGKWKTKTESRKNHKPYLYKRYKADRKVCHTCPFKEKCLSASTIEKNSGKVIERNEYQDYKDANDKRIAENKEFYRTRQQIVEHPFGTIKRAWGIGYTLLRTMPKVEAEMALAFLGYNILRAKNIMGTEELIKKLKRVKIRFVFMLKRIFDQFIAVLSYFFHDEKLAII